VVSNSTDLGMWVIPVDDWRRYDALG